MESDGVLAFIGIRCLVKQARNGCRASLGCDKSFIHMCFWSRSRHFAHKLCWISSGNRFERSCDRSRVHGH